MPAEIRRAHRADIDALVELENAAFSGDRLSRRSLHTLTGRRSAIVLVAVEETRIIGYALVLLRRLSRKARLYSIAVAPMATGRGVAGRLLETVEREALARGCGLMRLEVREDNSGAIALYEKSGYRCFGRRKNYYHDGMHALRYEKRLQSDASCRTHRDAAGC
ncbi:GNAT family N-acetyltransferase [Nitratireductor sp. ZSWI3]|uniref:GNAT family N-acetyltransferase n=1 Tax=Nitratireductor sp. ZSWI3 TaxID=2966359 RepID=UPI00214F98CE|nr:GNAT family N-acetyltransferase [Nitratireductor sp. ZSWI3]MCR4266890.1 GNAT family N-acetyltransferase [Nitratireductor sp. ZSWI3]